MTNETQRQGEEQADVLVRGEEGAWAVPVAVLDQYRVAPERRAGVEEDLRGHGQAIPAEVTLYELPTKALAPYRLPDAARAELDARLAAQGEGDDTGGFFKYAPNQPKGEPISGYTGYAYSVTFGALQRGASGHQVYVGVFPMWQAPASSGPYPGLR